MDSRIVQSIISKVLEHLSSSGVDTSFHVVKTEEGVFGTSSWYDFFIIEENEDPAVFSLFVEDSDSMVLSVMEKSELQKQGSWDFYNMDTKSFVLCCGEEDSITTFVACYQQEHKSYTECKES